jgi:hypothetical protein
MTDDRKTGKRVQIYLPGDLLEQWQRTPRYERSATVAAALRAYWAVRSSVRSDTPGAAENVPKARKSAKK